MLNSDKKSLLIEVHLTNGSGYDNPLYGIVDGVMYLISGSTTDFVYNTNKYHAGLVYSVGNMENAFDILGNIGGYKPFNEFEFTVIDEGLSQTLTSQGINFYRSQIVARVVIDNSVYPAYYGCIDNVSSTGSELRVITGDIALLKENNTPSPSILGEWNPLITSRTLELDNLEKEVSDDAYALIFWGEVHDPTNTSRSNYEANLQLYTTKVKDTGSAVPPFDGIFSRFYIDVYCEDETILGNNPNFTSMNDYVDYFKDYNLEILDYDGNVTEIFYIMYAEFNVPGYDGKFMRIFVYTDTSHLISNDKNVRFSYGKQSIDISSNEIEGNLSLYGNIDKSPLINITQLPSTSPTISTGQLIKSPLDRISYSTYDGKLPASVYVPSVVSTSMVTEDTHWFVPPNPKTITADQFTFVTNSEESDVYIGSVSKIANPLNKGRLAVNVDVDIADIPEGDWQIGFNIYLVGNDIDYPAGKGIGINSGDIIVFQNIALNDDPSRVLEIDKTTITAVDFGQGVYRHEDAGNTKYESFIGISPFPILNPFDDYGIDANAVYTKTESGFPVSIDKNKVSKKLYLQISFGIQLQDNTGQPTSTAHVYMPSFFFYKKDSSIEDTIIETASGELWSNDPKYISGASDTYPRTRTEISRYLLDGLALYEPSTEYIGDIFLPISADAFTVAYDTYKRTDKICTELIDELLTNSNFMLTGNMLGKRKMVNTYELANPPVAVTKAIVGSYDDVKINGYYSSVGNSWELKFDGSLELTALYDIISGDVIASSNTTIDENSKNSLLATLDDSVFFNLPSDVKKIESPFTNFGSPSFSTIELNLIADVYTWSHYKFSITIDMEDHMINPVYLGDWISFRDLQYTNDAVIYGMVQGVQINTNTGKVKLSCISDAIKPPASILDEQNGGYILDEQLGGVDLDEQ